MAKCPNCGSTAQVKEKVKDTEYSIPQRTAKTVYHCRCGCGCKFIDTIVVNYSKLNYSENITILKRGKQNGKDLK